MNSIDVIVPCYRYGHFLRECVTSVLKQQGVQVRVLIIDDESPDDTSRIGLQLCEEDSRVAYRRHSTNRGHIATYNEGLEWAQASYLLLLSADDYLLPGSLQRATEFMEAHREIGFTFGDAVCLDANAPLPKLSRPSAQSKGRILNSLRFIRMLRAGNFVATPTAVVRTSLQKQVGGYRADLPHSGDLEMWLRLAAWAHVGKIDCDQAVYRQHGHNMSLSYKREHCLPDLIQRKAAFDVLLEGRSTALPLPELGEAHRFLLQSLARTAVGYARMALDHGEMDLTDRLSAFAVDTYPKVRGTLTWKLLALQRRCGLRVPSPLMSAVNRLRRLAARA